MKGFLSKVLGYWMALGHLIGLVMTPVQLFLVYVLGFGPMNLVVRLTGRDLLDRRIGNEPTFWRKKEMHEPTLSNLRHTF